MGTTRKGEETRRRILAAAWDLSDARGAEALLGGVTLRELAAASGLSASAITYHFPTMADLGVAMAQHLLSNMSPLPVGVVDELLDQTVDQGLLGPARAAATMNWAVLTSPEEVLFDRRMRRCFSISADVPEIRAALAELAEMWVEDISLIFERTHERLQLAPTSPFVVRELALGSTALAEGMVHHWVLNPDGVRPDLVPDLLVALLSALVAPREHVVELAEIIAAIPTAGSDGSMSDPDELVALATAAGAAGLFAHGLGGVTLTKSARALGVPTEQLVVGFGSVRRLAACSFARHLEPVRTAIERRPAAGDHVSLTDGVYELVRCARADRHAALALLHERQLAHQGVDGGSRPDVMAAVPLDDLFVTPVATSTGATEASARELATLLVDTVLAQAATRRTATLADLTETALRLLPDPRR